MSSDSMEDILWVLERTSKPSREFEEALLHRLLNELQRPRPTGQPYLVRRLSPVVFGAGLFALLVVALLIAMTLVPRGNTPSASALELIIGAQAQFRESPPFQATISGRIPAEAIRKENPAYTGPDGSYTHRVFYKGEEAWRLEVAQQNPEGLIAGSAGSFWVWDGSRLGVYSVDDNSFRIEPVLQDFRPLGSLTWTATAYSEEICADSEVFPDVEFVGRSAHHVRCGENELWVDASTGLILKRILNEKPGDVGLVVEIAELDLNPEFASRTFEVEGPGGANDPEWEGYEAFPKLDRGEQVPGWTGRLVTGGDIRLDDLLGRPVLVLFWADWCEQCLDSLSAYEAASEQWDERAAFVSVLFPEPVSLEAASGYRFPVVDDSSGQIATAWGIQGVPAWVLLDAEGRVVDLQTGAKTLRDLDDMLGFTDAESPE